jgi:ankyrin repeat protein
MSDGINKLLKISTNYAVYKIKYLDIIRSHCIIPFRKITITGINMSESRTKRIRGENQNPSSDDVMTHPYSDTENEANNNAVAASATPSDSKFNFDGLPRDLATEIIKYLGPTDKIRFCNASSHYRLFFDESAAWRIRFIRHFPHLVCNYDMRAPLNFRQLFIDAESSEYAGLDIKFIHAFRAIKEGSPNVNHLDLTDHELSTQDASDISILMWASMKCIRPILDSFHQSLIEGLIVSRSLSAQMVRAQTLLESIILCRQGTEALTRCINEAPPAAVSDIMINRGYKLLQLAAQLGDAKSAEILLAWGCNPNTQDDNGYSALLHAAKFGHAPIVELLLDAGAHPNAVDKNDLHPLAIALLFGNFACAKLIAKAGGDPNAVTWYEDLEAIPMDSEEEPVLVTTHILTTATMCGRADMVASLIALGADVNCVNPTYNDPPLYYAVLSRHKECVDILLKANARMDLPTQTTKTNFTSYLSAAPADVQARIPAFLAQFPEDNFEVSIDQVAAALGYDEIAACLNKHRKETDIAEHSIRLGH